VRSGLHVRAGWNGVNDVHMDRAVEDAAKYANFAVITAFCAAGAFLLIIMSVGAGAMDVTVILMLVLLLVLLLAWPLLIRKFFAERQFADLLHGDGVTTSFQRSPDMGHTTLGWFLLAFGVYQLSISLPAAAILPDELARGMGRGGMDNPLSMMFMMMQNASKHSAWWPVGAAALQMWAAVELIRMTDNHRLVASIYGVIATAVAVYINLPSLDALKSQGLGGLLGGPAGPMGLAGIAIALIIPIGTLILVNRKPPAGR